MGFGRVIETASEAESQKIISEKRSARNAHVEKLVEKYNKTKGLALRNKVEKMMKDNSAKTENLLLFLEGTEKEAFACPTLAQNLLQQENIKKLVESKRLTEEMQTGGAMALMVPSDIVKIARIGYTNQIAQDVFDVWGMESMKDSLYKLETTYGSTNRGATKGDVVYESYNGGDYPTTTETLVFKQASGSATVTINQNDTFESESTSTSPITPVRPYGVSIYVDGAQVAVDDGNGNLVGKNIASGTIDYNVSAGTNVFVTFTLKSGTVATDSLVTIKYAYDFEDKALFDRTGSVLLQLKEYPFVAKLNPLEIEWTRYTEDLMNSKLGLSAKDKLIAGAGDEFRKATDERAIKKGIVASKWTNAVEFDCDWSTAGADSSMAHAQSVLQAIKNAENGTYKALGRLADKTNIVCSSDAVVYLSKHFKFEDVEPSSKNGIFQIGTLMGRGIYQAPDALFGGNTDVCYIFGKNMLGADVDAPVSIGTYGAGITTNPIELKNFNSQMGLGVYCDMRINNAQFATTLKLKNLSANA